MQTENDHCFCDTHLATNAYSESDFLFIQTCFYNHMGVLFL